MRLQFAFPVLLLSACAAPVNAPSLAPRPAEAIDPRMPVPEPALSSKPNPALVGQLNGLVAQAESGDAAFASAASAAERLVAAAGPSQSESWITAQEALSALQTSRAPVTSAAADIDALGSNRIQRLAGVAAADLKAIDTASAHVRGIDEREAATVKSLQDRLAR